MKKQKIAKHRLGSIFDNPGINKNEKILLKKVLEYFYLSLKK